MKLTATIFTLLFPAMALFGQAMTNQQIEQELNLLYERVLSNRFDTATTWEQSENDNNVFRKKLLNYLSNYPATLTYHFDSLRKNLDIVTSADNRFRIYSWDTWLGGTMHDFVNIFQFQSGDKVYTKVNYDTGGVGAEDYIPFYSKIFTLKTKDGTYYLAVNSGVYSTKDASQSIKAFTIEKNALNDSLKLFKTKTGLLNEIDVYFDFFSVVDRPERPLELINYDPDKQIIYIPVVLENGRVTNRYIRYQFMGQYFEPILTQTKRKNGK